MLKLIFVIIENTYLKLKLINTPKTKNHACQTDKFEICLRLLHSHQTPAEGYVQQLGAFKSLYEPQPDLLDVMPPAIVSVGHCVSYCFVYKLATRLFILLNRTTSYCVINTVMMHSKHSLSKLINFFQFNQIYFKNLLLNAQSSRSNVAAI